jgi:hypothetical protein
VGQSWIALSWAPPATLGGAPVSYKILIDDGAGGAFSVIYDGPALTFNATGLLSGTSYRFSVTAYNCVGAAATSSTLTKSTVASAPAAPAAPFLVSATASSIEVGWVPPPSGGAQITQMNLFMTNATLPNAWRMIYSGLATAFNQSNLPELTSFSFKVNAVNSLGTGANSSAAIFRTASASATAPNATSAPTASNPTYYSLFVSWTAPSDGGSQIIEYLLCSRSDAAPDFVLAYRGPNIAANLTSLSPGTTYSFQVAARNSIGTSSNSSIGTGSTVALPIPIAAPQLPVIISAPSAAATYTSTVSAIGGKVKISWGISDGLISIKLECQCTGWVGFGLGANMARADMILARVIKNQVYINDCWSTDQAQPALDTKLGGTESLLSFSGSESNGVTVIEFVRAMNASDAQQDLPITSGPNDVLVAFHPTDDNFALHDTNRDQLKIDFIAGSGNALGGGAATVAMRISHGALMFISWGAVLPLGIMFAKYTKNIKRLNAKLPAAWFKVHRLTQSLGYLVAIVAVIIAFVMVSGGHFKTPNGHAQLGIAVMVGGLVQIVIVVFRPHPPAKGEKKSCVRLSWEWQHVLLGRLTAIAGIPTIITGLLSFPAGDVLIAIYIVWACVLVIGVALLEILRCLGEKKNERLTSTTEDSKL